MAGEPILGLANFQTQEDPFTVAIRAYQGMVQGRGQALQNQKLQAEQPYWGRMAETGLQKNIADLMGQELENKYYAPKAEALIGQQEASAQFNRLRAAGYPQELAARIAQANAATVRAQASADQARTRAQYPVTSGVAGQNAAYNAAMAAGDTEGAKRILQGIEDVHGSRLTSAQHDWSSLTAPQKEGELSGYRGIPGITDQKALSYWKQGIGPRDAAIKEGMSPEKADQLEPVYQLTSKDVSAQHARAGAVAEEDYFANTIANGGARYRDPYLPKVKGVPVNLAYDILTGANKQDQIDYVVATMAQLEDAATRLKTASLTGGITQTLHALDTGILNLPIPEGIPNSLWKEAQIEYSKKLREGAKEYTKAVHAKGTASEPSQYFEDYSKEQIDAMPYAQAKNLKSRGG